MGNVTFGAVGDIAFFEGTADTLKAEGPDWAFEKVLPLLNRADVLFGNFEFVFLPEDFPREQIDPSGSFSAVPGDQGAAALRRAGFDFLNLAANHVLDGGSLGLDYTRNCLVDAGIGVGGVGYTQEEARQLHVVEKDGLAFGFLCYAEDNNWTLGATNPGPAYYEVDKVLEDVGKHRQAVDVLVVSIHADLEFLPVPAPVRMENSRRIARAGADLVLEHHPHVPQGVELVDGSLIAYSLGNFLFGAYSSNYMRMHGQHTGHTYALLVQVDRAGVQSFERVPCVIGEPPDERPRPAQGELEAELLSYFEKLDEWLSDEAFVRRTWREQAKEMLRRFIQKAASRDADGVIKDLVGRAMFVAENRRWVEEILEMTSEHWADLQGASDPYRRPNYRFQKSQ
jgi:poly-gamma-glutamate synthesis protein (capsule biosynthesis protein)